MSTQYDLPPTEERLARREARKERQRQRLRERRRRRLRLLALLPLLGLALFLFMRKPQARPGDASSAAGTSVDAGTGADASQSAAPPETPPEPPAVFALSAAGDTQTLEEDFPSTYALLADADSGAILAEKDSDAVISPASMTKILTLLVAAETITDWDQSFTMTREVADYCYRNDCSVVGYEVGEKVGARELLYGTILPSGADAALGLAILSAGSQEAFVERMNGKCAELGLSEGAHFTNCVGLYHPDHHCTLRDVALILRAAMDDPLCREVLTTKRYQSAATDFHPQGQALSNWFLRRIEDKDSGAVTVLGAKTGYVAQSGSCAASYGESAGHHYLCVTADAHSAWRAIYDHVELYRRFGE